VNQLTLPDLDDLFVFRPTDPDAEAAFRTYRNYLVGLTLLLRDLYGWEDADRRAGVVIATHRTKNFGRIQRATFTLEEERAISQALQHAWLMEAQLMPWLVGDRQAAAHMIQAASHPAYYALFHAGRALLLVQRQNVPKSHAGVLSALGSIASGRSIFPAPWCVTCQGGPSAGTMGCSGWPGHAPAPSGVHNLSTPTAATMWDVLHKILATTRRKQIESRKAEQRSARSRLPRGEVAAIVRDLRPTTLFDFMWRLRVRFDYDDSNVALRGVSHDSEATNFLWALSLVAHDTMCVLETLTARYLGRERYGYCVEACLPNLPVDHRSVAKARRDVIVSKR
jgi:hypothetical protein